MKYFLIEPEVAGGLGEGTIIDRSSHPPKASNVHYEFSGWLGDVLLESFPVLIVTEKVGMVLVKGHLSGVSLLPVRVSMSQEFRDQRPGLSLPPFVMLDINGTILQDDFATALDGRLVVSKYALDELSNFSISHALIEPFLG